jgi:hypothetical protein
MANCFGVSLATVKGMRGKSKEGNEDNPGKWTLQEVQRMLLLDGFNLWIVKRMVLALCTQLNGWIESATEQARALLWSTRQCRLHSSLCRFLHGLMKLNIMFVRVH